MYGLENEFPNLSQDNCSLTSPQTWEYNCIAWAANDDERWWWPQSEPQAYWPPDIRNEVTVEAFTQAFALLGYAPCADESLVENIEKVALYVDNNNVPQHMSRQLSDGGWTSKLGRSWDISHTHNSVLDGPSYGTAKYFYSRPK